MAKREQKPENIERGARLKVARVEARYETGEDAAADLDMPYSTYDNHETGWRGITRKQAKIYAKFFKVNLDWLYENIGPRKGPATPKTAETRDLLEGLPPEGQREVLEHLEYVKTKYGV